MRAVVLVAAAALMLSSTACTPRVNLVTGTTIGLKATPGDGNTRPPQIMLGYKRAELALVPTDGSGASKTTDAQSTLAAFYFNTLFFGNTELDSFIATGYAAQKLAASREYVSGVKSATLRVVPAALQQRRVALASKADVLTEAQAQTILTSLNYDKEDQKTAKESLKDYIGDADTVVLVERLESAFFRTP